MDVIVNIELHDNLPRGRCFSKDETGRRLWSTQIDLANVIVRRIAPEAKHVARSKKRCKEATEMCVGDIFRRKNQG